MYAKMNTGCVFCMGNEPTGGRIDESHVSTRFGDHMKGSWEVLLDGVPIQSLCTEACGSQGWAYVVPTSPPSLCIGTNHHYLFKVEGNIQIRHIRQPRIET